MVNGNFRSRDCGVTLRLRKNVPYLSLGQARSWRLVERSYEPAKPHRSTAPKIRFGDLPYHHTTLCLFRVHSQHFKSYSSSTVRNNSLGTHKAYPRAPYVVRSLTLSEIVHSKKRRIMKPELALPGKKGICFVLKGNRQEEHLEKLQKLQPDQHQRNSFVALQH